LDSFIKISYFNASSNVLAFVHRIKPHSRKERRVIIIRVEGIPALYPKELLGVLLKELEAAAGEYDRHPPKGFFAFFPTDLYQTDLGQNFVLTANVLATGKVGRCSSFGEKLAAVLRSHFKTAQIIYDVQSYGKTMSWHVMDPVEIATDPELAKCPVCGSGRNLEEPDHHFILCPNCGGRQRVTIN
jgi:hypothetical protein